MTVPGLALLQLCDSLFPVGSFAHSDGLEAAVSAGHVAAPGDLRQWLEAALLLTLKQTEMPAVRDAFGAAMRDDLEALGRIDAEIDAMRASAAGREASRSMGTRLLKTWQQIRPSSLVESALSARGRYTFPAAFGVVCVASQVGKREALEAFCYTRLAAAVSAAMRLMPVGQHVAHSLLAEVLDRVPAVAEEIRRSDASPRGFMPMLDIATMSHRYVHSRLFRS